jgi:hypothetical protein
MQGESTGVNPLVAIRYLNSSPSNRDSAGTVSPLTKMAVGTEIEGFVLSRTSSLQPILRTPIGDIVIESSLFLKTGSEVTIRVDPNIAGRARIVRIDGLSPQQYAHAHASRATANSSVALTHPNADGQHVPSSTAGGASASPAQQTRVIQALFIAPAGVDKAAGTASALSPHILSPTVTLPNGQVFSPETALVSQLRATIQARPSFDIQLLAQALPTAQASTTQQAPSVNMPASHSPPPPVPTMAGHILQSTFAALGQPNTEDTASYQETAAANAPTRLPSGSSPNATATTTASSAAGSATSFATSSSALSMRPDGVPAPPASASPAPSGQPTPLHPAPAAPAITEHQLKTALTGTIIRAEPHSPPVVQTAIGQFQLLHARPMPVGSTILFSVGSPPHSQSPITTPLLPPELAAVAPLMQQWETLQETMELAQSAYPQAAQTLAAHLPQTGSTMAATILFILNALKGESLRALLGQDLHDILEAQHSSLFRRLSTEWSSIQHSVREPISSEWHMYLIPMWHEKQAEQIRLFVRRDTHKETEENDAKRFLLELHLSELGDVQMDGFVHGTKPALQFDMVFRTERPWPDALSRSLQQIFTQSLEAMGMQGGLRTQVGQHHFIRPLTHDDTLDTSGQPGHTDGVIA